MSEQCPPVDQFLETKALWLLMEGREDEARFVLETMTATELYQFGRQIDALRGLVSSAFWRKKGAAASEAANSVVSAGE
jgi:hypothetical protein